MLYLQPYIDYLAEFHGSRDYFECHELLEDHWKQTGGGRNSVWVCLIQAAVGLYHYRRGNVAGAGKLTGKALAGAASNMGKLEALGIDSRIFIALLTERMENIRAHVPYRAESLPIADQLLLELAEKRCRELGYTWGWTEDSENWDLVHRHHTRNRNGVVLERKRMLAAKRQLRNRKSASARSLQTQR